MTEKTKEKFIVVVLKQSWIASTFSDIQTFGIMCAAFGVNSLYLNNNGWLNFCLTIAFITWVFAKAVFRTRKSERVTSLTTSSYDEAFDFLKGHGPKKGE